jgi:hypothetical protein
LAKIKAIKQSHEQITKSENAIFSPYTDYVSDKKYSTHKLEKIAKTTSKLFRMPINWLVNHMGELPGVSDEPDNSRKFKRRVKGLDLNAYFSGKYPPILILKRGHRYDVINGRHRTINFINKLDEGGIDLNSARARIKARIIDLDNPAVINLLKRARDQECDYSLR